MPESELPVCALSCQAHHSALKRYTAYPHFAGSGFDLVSAVNLKNEWEKALGVPVSGPEEHMYDAGDNNSQKRIRGRSKLGVWIDTVRSALLCTGRRVDDPVLPNHQYPSPCFRNTPY